MSHNHIVSLKTYFFIFFVLIVFTAITVWVGFQNFGALNTPIALGIAIFKATLVLLYFMHLRYSSGLMWLVLASSIFTLALMIAFTYSDVATRSMTTIPASIGM